MKKSTKLKISKWSVLSISRLVASCAAPGLIVFGVAEALAGEAPTDVFADDNVSELTRFLGGLHPLSVHFPLALILAAFVFELIFLKSANQKWRLSATHTLTLGALISLVTISLGLLASEVGPFLGPDADLLWRHRLFGLLTSALALGATYMLAQSRLSGKKEKRARTFELGYRIALTLATITVFIAGHYGAELAGL